MAKKQKTEGKETRLDKMIKENSLFIIAIIGLIVIFLIFYYASHGLGKINYQGLTFTKEKFGNILLYRYNYLVKSDNGRIIQQTIYLRNDPRYNDVPVNGEIIYPLGKRVYISINGTGLTECEDNLISVASLSNFLASNNLLIKAGTPDENEAKLNNQTYVSCERYPDNTVIALKSSNETRIERANKYCYNIKIANCEILKAVEKFIVQSIIDAKKAAS